MPKRSNDFQRLVKAIYDAVASVEGGTVTECAVLREPSGTPREVDVLLEASLYGHPLRIAVECRDRSRKSDIEWIDALVGKYRNLAVQKIIAVSRRGFSAPAQEKATQGGIETRSLDECADTDWSSEFIKIGVGEFTFSPQVESVTIELFPAADFPLALESTIENPDGRSLGTVEWMLMDCYRKNVAPRIKEFVEKEFLPVCRVLADLRKKWEVTVPVDINGAFLKGDDGSRPEVKKVTYVVKAHTEVTRFSVHHYRYGEKARASVARLKFPPGELKLRIVQIAGSKVLSVTSERTPDDSPNRRVQPTAGKRGG